MSISTACQNVLNLYFRQIMSASETAEDSHRTTPLSWRLRATFSAMVLFVLFFQLGTRGLNEPDEGRFSEVGREMAASGDYLTPRLNGIEHLSKPPVTYWLVAFSIKIFGNTEFAARLPAALAALGTLVAVFLIMRSAQCERTAWWAVAVLISSVGFFGVARLITTDMILTCFITWSIWSFWRWYVSEDRSWGKIVWFYVFLALGTLTKGPVAIAIPMLGILALRWRNPRLQFLKMHWGKGALVFFAIAAPWFILVAGENPALWDYFIKREVVERVTTTVHGRVHPWWFFFPILAVAFLPWTLFLSALGNVLRDRKTEEDQNPLKFDVVRLCLGWAGLGFVLFTLSQSKLPTYILPLIPALAMMVAMVIEKKSGDFFRICGFISALLLLGAVVGLSFYAHKKCGLGWEHLAFLLIVTSSGVGACLGFLVKGKTFRFAATLAGMALFVWLSCVQLYPALEKNLSRNTTAKYFGERILRESPEKKPIVISYVTFLRGLPYYLNQCVLWYNPASAAEPGTPQDVFEFSAFRGTKPMVLTDWTRFKELMAGPERVFCVASSSDIATMRLELKLPLYELEKTGRWSLVSNQPSRLPTGP